MVAVIATLVLPFSPAAVTVPVPLPLPAAAVNSVSSATDQSPYSQS